ncbi:hypothetical protein CU254_00455 [Amycolatopsis sp. AA4]|uniref:M91 family zinc metallopeptidase n=1 Tax=Actinomycetes TaxID=1760 RepID=UPI0009980E3B|nr:MULTISPECIES: M91 family zinc metallopeptidase [Actinomycetes]ATY09123.1 hypothetical protein CU254_00455 [Amycolatopsis sp. AA4]
MKSFRAFSGVLRGSLVTTVLAALVASLTPAVAAGSPAASPVRQAAAAESSGGGLATSGARMAGPASGGVGVRQAAPPQVPEDVEVTLPGTSSRMRGVRIPVPGVEKSGIVVVKDLYGPAIEDAKTPKVVKFEDAPGGAAEAERFVKRMQDAVAEIAKSPDGARLLRGISEMRPLDQVGMDLATGQKDVTVVLHRSAWGERDAKYSNTAFTMAYDDTRAANGVGSPAEIVVPNESYAIFGVNLENSRRYMIREQDALAHEFIHASHYLEGSRYPHSADGSPVPITYTYTTYLGEKKHREVDIPLEEIRTLGGPDALLAAEQQKVHGLQRLVDKAIANSRLVMDTYIKLAPDRATKKLLKKIRDARNAAPDVTETSIAQQLGITPRRHYANISGTADAVTAAANEISQDKGIHWKIVEGEVKIVRAGTTITVEDTRDPAAVEQRLGGQPQALPLCPSSGARAACIPKQEPKDVPEATRSRVNENLQFVKSNPDAVLYRGEPIGHPGLREQGSVAKPDSVYLGVEDERGPAKVFSAGISAPGTEYSTLTDQWLQNSHLDVLKDSGWVTTTESADRAKAEAVPLSRAQFQPGTYRSPPRLVAWGWVYEIEPTEFFVSAQASAARIKNGYPDLPADKKAVYKDFETATPLSAATQATREWSAIRRISPENIIGAKHYRATYQATSDGRVADPNPKVEELPAGDAAANRAYKPAAAGYDPYADRGSGWSDTATVFKPLDRDPWRGAVEAQKILRGIPVTAQTGGTRTGVQPDAVNRRASDIVRDLLQDKQFMAEIPRPVQKPGSKELVWSKENAKAALDKVQGRLKNQFNLTEGPLNKAFLALWAYDMYELAKTHENVDGLEIAARVTALVPGLGDALGLADGINRGDAEAIAVNSVAMAAFMGALVVPALGQLLGGAVLTYTLGKLASEAVRYVVNAVAQWFTPPPEFSPDALRPGEIPTMPAVDVQNDVVPCSTERVITWKPDPRLKKDVDLVIRVTAADGGTYEMGADPQAGRRVFLDSSQTLTADLFYRAKRPWGTFVSHQITRQDITYRIGAAGPFPSPRNRCIADADRRVSWPVQDVGWIAARFPALFETRIPGRVSAAFAYPNSWDQRDGRYTAFGFFKGDTFVSYDDREDRLRDNTPKKIGDAWPGLGGSAYASGVDAAVDVRDDYGGAVLLLFKGNKMGRYKYAGSSSRLEWDDTIANRLHGLPPEFADGVDAVLPDSPRSGGLPGTDRIVLLKGDRYALYDLREQRRIPTGSDLIAARWRVPAGVDLRRGVDSALAISPDQAMLFAGQRAILARDSGEAASVPTGLPVSVQSAFEGRPDRFWSYEDGPGGSPRGRIRTAAVTDASSPDEKKKATFALMPSDIPRCYRLRTSAYPDPPPGGFADWEQRAASADDIKYSEAGRYVCPSRAPGGGFVLHPADLKKKTADNGRVLYAQAGLGQTGPYFANPADLSLVDQREFAARTTWHILAPHWSSEVDLPTENTASLVDVATRQAVLKQRDETNLELAADNGDLAWEPGWRSKFRLYTADADQSCYTFHDPWSRKDLYWDSETNKVSLRDPRTANDRGFAFCTAAAGDDGKGGKAFSLRPLGFDDRVLGWDPAAGAFRMTARAGVQSLRLSLGTPHRGTILPLMDAVDTTQPSSVHRPPAVSFDPVLGLSPLAPGKTGEAKVVFRNTQWYTFDVSGTGAAVTLLAPAHTRFVPQNQLQWEVSADGGKSWNKLGIASADCKALDEGQRLECPKSSAGSIAPGALIRLSPVVSVAADAPADRIPLPGRALIAMRLSLAQRVGTATAGIHVYIQDPNRSVRVRRSVVAASAGEQARLPFVLENAGHHVEADFGPVTFTAPEHSRFENQAEVSGHTVGNGIPDTPFTVSECAVRSLEAGKHDNRILACAHNSLGRTTWRGALGDADGKDKADERIVLGPLLLRVDQDAAQVVLTGGTVAMTLATAVVKRPELDGGAVPLGTYPAGGAALASIVVVGSVGFAGAARVPWSDEGMRPYAMLAPGHEGPVPWMMRNTGYELKSDMTGTVTFRAPAHARFVAPKDGKIPMEYSFGTSPASWRNMEPSGGRDPANTLHDCVATVDGKTMTCQNTGRKQMRWQGGQGAEGGKDKNAAVVRFRPTIRVDDDAPVDARAPGECGSASGDGTLELANATQYTDGGKWVPRGDTGRLSVRSDLALCIVDKTDRMSQPDSPPAKVFPGGETTVTWEIANNGYQLNADYTGDVVFTAPDNMVFLAPPDQKIPLQYSEDGGRTWRTDPRNPALFGCYFANTAKIMTCRNIGDNKAYPYNDNAWAGLWGNDLGGKKFALRFRFQVQARMNDDAPVGTCMNGGTATMNLANARRANGQGGEDKAARWNQLGSIALTGKLAVCTESGFPDAKDRSDTGKPALSGRLSPDGTGPVPWLVSNAGPNVSMDYTGTMVFHAPDHTTFVPQPRDYIRLQYSYDDGRSWVDADGNAGLYRCRTSSDKKTMTCNNTGWKGQQWYGSSGDGNGKRKFQMLRFLPILHADADSPVGNCSSGRQPSWLTLDNVEQDNPQGGKNKYGTQYAFGTLRTCFVNGFEGSKDRAPITSELAQWGTAEWQVSNSGYEVVGDFAGKVVFHFGVPGYAGFVKPQEGKLPLRYSLDDGKTWKSDRALTGCAISNDKLTMTCDNTQNSGTRWYGALGNAAGPDAEKDKREGIYQILLPIWVSPTLRGRCLPDGTGVLSIKNAVQWDGLAARPIPRGEMKVTGKLKVCVAKPEK